MSCNLRLRYFGLRVVPSLPLIDHRYLAFAFAQCPALNYSAAVLAAVGPRLGARTFGMRPCVRPLGVRPRALRARCRGSPLMGRALRSASGGGLIGETSDILNSREQSSHARPPLARIK